MTTTNTSGRVTANDDLDVLAFDDMPEPTFITISNSVLVLTSAESFVGFVDIWKHADSIARRDLFLKLGNAHLAERWITKLDHVGRDHVLEHLPEVLPVEDLTTYTRLLVKAIKDAPMEPPKDNKPKSITKKLTDQEREAYRRCLLVRAMAYGGTLEVPIFALASGLIPEVSAAPTVNAQAARREVHR